MELSDPKTVEGKKTSISFSPGVRPVTRTFSLEGCVSLFPTSVNSFISPTSSSQANWTKISPATALALNKNSNDPKKFKSNKTSGVQ
jgi:hypothetical protein